MMLASKASSPTWIYSYRRRRLVLYSVSTCINVACLFVTRRSLTSLGKKNLVVVFILCHNLVHNFHIRGLISNFLGVSYFKINIVLLLTRHNPTYTGIY